MVKKFLMLVVVIFFGINLSQADERDDAREFLMGIGAITENLAYEVPVMRKESAIVIKRFALSQGKKNIRECEFWQDVLSLPERNEILEACKVGLFRPATNFYPERNLSRGDLIIVLARFLSENATLELDDAYNFLLQKGVIKVDDRKIASRATLRSEVYLMLYRLGKKEEIYIPTTEMINEICLDSTYSNQNFETIFSGFQGIPEIKKKLSTIKKDFHIKEDVPVSILCDPDYDPTGDRPRTISFQIQLSKGNYLNNFIWYDCNNTIQHCSIASKYYDSEESCKKICEPAEISISIFDGEMHTLNIYDNPYLLDSFMHRGKISIGNIDVYTAQKKFGIFNIPKFSTKTERLSIEQKCKLPNGYYSGQNLEGHYFSDDIFAKKNDMIYRIKFINLGEIANSMYFEYLDIYDCKQQKEVFNQNIHLKDEGLKNVIHISADKQYVIMGNRIYKTNYKILKIDMLNEKIQSLKRLIDKSYQGLDLLGIEYRFENNGKFYLLDHSFDIVNFDDNSIADFIINNDQGKMIKKLRIDIINKKFFQ